MECRLGDGLLYHRYNLGQCPYTRGGGGGGDNCDCEHVTSMCTYT